MKLELRNFISLVNTKDINDQVFFKFHDKSCFGKEYDFYRYERAEIQVKKGFNSLLIYRKALAKTIRNYKKRGFVEIKELLKKEEL